MNGLFNFGGKFGPTMTPAVNGQRQAAAAPGMSQTSAQKQSQWFKDPRFWGDMGAALVMGNNGARSMAHAMQGQKGRAGDNATLEFLKNAGAQPDELQMAQQSKEVRDLMLKRAFERQPQAKKPSSVLEYEYGIKNPEYTDWKRANSKSGATNVTVGGGKYGTIPPGYELVETPEGSRLLPIQGGPAAAKEEAAAKAGVAKQATTERYGNVVIEDIDRAIATLNDEASWFDGAGLDGKLLAGVPGTNAHKLSKFMSTIQGNAGFDKLQQMRDSSPTGGALGAVSKTEMDLLVSAIGSLEQSQDKETLEYNLKRVRSIYQQIIHGPTAPAAPDAPAAAPAPAAQNRTKSGISWSVSP